MMYGAPHSHTQFHIMTTPTAPNMLTATKIMEWFLLNDCMVVNRGRFESGESSDMMREFILYVSGNATPRTLNETPPVSHHPTGLSTEANDMMTIQPSNDVLPEPVANTPEPPHQPSVPIKKKRRVPIELSGAGDTQCAIVRRTGNRCMRQRNNNGCPEFCGTHSAMLIKSNLTKDEFIEKCTKAKVVTKPKRTTKPSIRSSATTDTTSDGNTANTANSNDSGSSISPSPTNTAPNHGSQAKRNRVKNKIVSKKPPAEPAKSTIFHNGIPHVIDSSGKVFSHRDIIEEKADPCIIGSYMKDSAGVVTVILFDDVSVIGRASPVELV